MDLLLELIKMPFSKAATYTIVGITLLCPGAIWLACFSRPAFLGVDFFRLSLLCVGASFPLLAINFCALRVMAHLRGESEVVLEEGLPFACFLTFIGLVAPVLSWALLNALDSTSVSRGIWGSVVAEASMIFTLKVLSRISLGQIRDLAARNRNSQSKCGAEARHATATELTV